MRSHVEERRLAQQFVVCLGGVVHTWFGGFPDSAASSVTAETGAKRTKAQRVLRSAINGGLAEAIANFCNLMALHYPGGRQDRQGRQARARRQRAADGCLDEVRREEG